MQICVLKKKIISKKVYRKTRKKRKKGEKSRKLVRLAKRKGLSPEAQTCKKQLVLTQITKK
jgi:hypothetical protein